MTKMKFYESPDTLAAEQDQFEVDIKSYTSGHINPVKFKAIRVAHGVYEQRQEHTYMIRIRCAAGGITPQQLRHTAKIAKQYGSGEVHFTTRQEVQIHNVLVQDVLHAIRGLKEVDLSTRGGGGNTIRNILTSPLSGIEEGEVFDVDPYAIALTTRMIAEPDSWNLPRKFKIAFSNSAQDTAFTQATCLGFVAKIKDGKKGFAVYTAGGMGAKPMVGHELFDFIPDTQVYHVTRAIKTMFDKHGNRRSKYSSRIKFLWKKLDETEFKRIFHEDYDPIKNDESLALDIKPIQNEQAQGISIEQETCDSPEFNQFKERFVSNQKQDGLVTIKLPLVLGDLLHRDAERLCDVLDHFGDNCIRCDRAQNMRLRNIPQAYVPNIFNVIRKMEHTLADRAAFVGNMINCTGAQTCKLGICLPRGLSEALRDEFKTQELNLDAIPEFTLNMSGCPNTCGMHHVADLGFFGKIGRKEGQIYPAYNVLAGAQTGAGKTRYAQKEGELSAKHVPTFVCEFLSHYIEQKDEYDTYHEYLDKEGRTLIHTLCEKYKDVPTKEEDVSYYIDFGAKRGLRLDDMGTAECSAGMFDMITVDRREIESILKRYDNNEAMTVEDRYTIVFRASRMLLVTRGLEATTDDRVFELFNKQFIQAGIVDEKFTAVVEHAKKKDHDYLQKNHKTVIELSESVRELYKNMDDSLRFKVKKSTQNKSEQTTTKKDFRGVACPMNFVKTKLALDTIQTGDFLEIKLDDGEPINNVPNSIKQEGHAIESKHQDQNTKSWTVVIKKA
ncbi:sulfurtransferase TusA family protein [bacterium]|nr:sulfurtransferase TusA family protein [bacterium]